MTIQLFAKVDNLPDYFQTWEKFNLGVLRLMEREKIELFVYTPIAILPNPTQLSAYDK
jgi:hypothetical protein